jgi:hypothetical protein
MKLIRPESFSSGDGGGQKRILSLVNPKIEIFDKLVGAKSGAAFNQVVAARHR